MASFDPALVDAFLAHHWKYRPVDASFMGVSGFDAVLPPVGADVAAAEQAEIDALLERVAATDEPDDLGERLDRRFMLSELAVRRDARSRFGNPAWYTGEAAFAIIVLLLPQSQPVRSEALLSRLSEIPAFLQAGREQITGKAVPKSWADRARNEAAAMVQFLRSDIAVHEAFEPRWSEPGAAAAASFEEFAASLAGLPDADPACGAPFLSLLIKEAHGLDMSAAEAAALAEAAFDRLGGELTAMAAAIDPAISWEDQVAALADDHPATPEAVLESYRHWDDRALAACAGLVTPARDYRLDYRWLAPCFCRVFPTLYFLLYRSPPGLDAGSGSVYWVVPPGDDVDAFLRANSTIMVKTIHAVHHGSIGHHTQNANARRARSRLAQLAGTDCALGLSMLGAGTLVEGWACYAQDLLLEAPGFYTPAEALLLKSFERRNAASVLVDIKLHLGEWSMDEAMAFYRDKAGFAPSRVEGEVVRNSILPGSRLMYWLGVEGIKALRKRWRGGTLEFHDTLLSFGHVPLAWIREEMERMGQLNP